MAVVRGRGETELGDRAGGIATGTGSLWTTKASQIDTCLVEVLEGIRKREPFKSAFTPEVRSFGIDSDQCPSSWRIRGPGKGPGLMIGIEGFQQLRFGLGVSGIVANHHVFGL